MPADAGVQWSHRDIKRIVGGVMLGMLLAAFDQTMVVTALPTMAAELNGLQHLSWIVTAYLLTSTASTPIYGKLSDLYGRRRLLQIAIAMFVVVRPSARWRRHGQLIAARALQGIGGGGLISMAQAIIADVISPRERGRYQAYMSGIWALASIGGPVLGGFFVDYLSWRWVFWINLPIGSSPFCCAGCAAPARIRGASSAHRLSRRRASDRRRDGAAAGRDLGRHGIPWISPEILGSPRVASYCSLAFALQELRAPEPILPPRLFRNPVIRVASLDQLRRVHGDVRRKRAAAGVSAAGRRHRRGQFGPAADPAHGRLGGRLLLRRPADARTPAATSRRRSSAWRLDGGWLLLATMTQTTPGWLAAIYMGAARRSASAAPCR